MSARLSLAITLVLSGCGRVAFDGMSDAATSDSFVVADAAGDATSRVCPPTLMFDEDSDSVDDSCDVCPHLVENQQDTDGDGVGDPCDPQPFIAAEYIAWFDGFHAVLPEWETNNPLVDGQMVIDVTTTSSSSVINLGGSHWRIHVGGDIFTVGPTPQQFFIAGQVTPNESYYVEVINSGSGRRRSLMHSVDAMYTELDGVTDTGMAIPSGPLGVELTNVPDQLGGVIGLAPDTTFMFGPGLGTVETYRYVLYVAGMSVALDYALVIGGR